MNKQPMTVPEHEFLIGDGSMAGAFAGLRLRYVHDDDCPPIRANEWREHHRQTGHEAWAFERIPDYITDCVVIIDGPAVWPPEWTETESDHG